MDHLVGIVSRRKMILKILVIMNMAFNGSTDEDKTCSGLVRNCWSVHDENTDKMLLDSNRESHIECWLAENLVLIAEAVTSFQDTGFPRIATPLESGQQSPSPSQ